MFLAVCDCREEGLELATAGDAYAGSFSMSIVSVEFELGDKEAIMSVVQG